MTAALIRTRCVIAATLMLASVSAVCASDVGRRLPSEKRVFTDKVTGVQVTALTTDPANDMKIYQTHPQWTADGQWIVFRSNRAALAAAVSADGATANTPPATAGASTSRPADGKAAEKAAAARPPLPSQVYAVNENTGEIVQLTDSGNPATGMLTLSRKSMKLYFLRYPGQVATDAPSVPVKMIELNLEKLLADSAAGKMQDAAAYERVCGTLPDGMRDSGGFDLDADETHAYIGVRGGDAGTHLPAGTKIIETAPGQRMGAGPAGIRSMNLETGEVKVVIDTPFLMGHVQTNPWVPGEIIYCHETGGDAPQRIWTVMADGSGNRPLYAETPDEWITHEAVITKDELVFNIIGHIPRLRLKPSGIAVINLRTNFVRLWGQVDDQPDGSNGPGGYWHSNGSSDGRWLVGDTFAGNIWLIDRRNGAQTLLTTDHKMRPDHTHPTFSPDSRRILFQSGLLSDGVSLDLMVVEVPEHPLK